MGLDRQMRMMEKALQRGGDDTSERFAEARTVAGSSSSTSPQDATLNWAGGNHTATVGVGDKPLSAELANVAGVGSSGLIPSSTAPTPDGSVRPTPRSDQGQRSGVDAVVRGQ